MDKPFTISSEFAKEAYCGGEHWLDGELLGFWKGNELRTAIIDGKIYIREDNIISENKFSVLQASETKYKNTIENLSLFNNCVNSRDPSTITEKYLGSYSAKGIYCNDILIKDKMFLGSFFQSPNRTGRQVDTYAVIDHKLKLLRISHSEKGGDNNYDQFNRGLMANIIDAENGSYLSQDVKNFKMGQIKGCFYDELPRYSDGPSDCLSDIALKEVGNVTPDSLNFLYEGSGINTVKWIINSKLNDIPVANGSTNVVEGKKSATISYKTLKPGDYVLSVRSGSCISSDSSTSLGFTLSESLAIITSFNARSTGDEVELSWKVNSHVSESGFEVIRYNKSMEVKESLGTVAGEKVADSKYTFLDNKPNKGISLYQLRSKDKDNRQIKSDLVQVNSLPIKDVTVSPNPSSEFVDVKWLSQRSGNAVLKVYTITGNQISTRSVGCVLGVEKCRIDIKSLDPGHYFISISMEGQNEKTRFVKIK